MPCDAPVTIAVFLSDMGTSLWASSDPIDVSDTLESGLSQRAVLARFEVKKRRSLEPVRRFHGQPCPMRSARRRGRELERSAPPCDSAPARRDQTRDRTYPRSPAGAAASRASMPAISDNLPHWFDSRRTGRSKSRPGRADRENKIRRSTNQDRIALPSDRFRDGAYASSSATGDLFEARSRSERDRPKRPAVLPSSHPGLRCARQHPEQ